MRRLTLALLAAAAACVPPPSADDGGAYLDDAVARRAALLASLDGVDNGYAALRRARYASGDATDWELLPVWNPRVQPLVEADVAAGVRGDSPFTGTPRALDIPTARSAAALADLGAAAFFSYPAQLLPAAATLGAADLPRYGLWSDGARGVGGLVRAEMADGSARLAYTCATCHAATPADGALVVGLGNAALDLGAWLADAAAASDPTGAADDPRASWGPGRVDVATTTGLLPVNLPDLRPTRFLTHLHYEADVAQLGVASLAIRIETLLITSHGEVLRPPREVALGLALYVRSLAGALPAPPARAPDAFAARCAVCHAGPGLDGQPVDASVVGTDPAAALDPDRGTGRYRIPSLRGVSARGQLMHDGSVRGVGDLVDPARLAAGRAGHPFGLDLDSAARADLAAYLHAL
jgi:hypothetical protein